MITIQEYREILNDQTSTEEQIVKRLQYLEAFQVLVQQLVVAGCLHRSLKTMHSRQFFQAFVSEYLK